MKANQIRQLRSFERMVTYKIIEIYNAYLTNEKKEELSKNTLIKDDYTNTFTSPENIQGEIIRLVFKEVFKNIKCTKSINFSDGSKRNIDYGTDIYYGLISYYSKDLSSKINFKIDTNSEYELYYDLIIKLKEKLNMVFETMAFNCDALTLLNAANEETLTKESDKDAVKRYITENKKKETEKTSLNIKVFPLLYIKGVQYLKYIDESKEEHLIKISNPSLTSKTYKELLTKQNTTAEDILSSLANNKEAIPDINKNLTPSSKLSHGEKDLLDTFYGKKEEIFNDELEKTQKLDRFTNIKLITEEEYEKLCMKSVNNKKLTDEELAQMEYFDIYYFGSGSNQNSKEEKQLVSSRWNDCSTMSIIHTPTEEERKEAVKEMVDNAVRNIEKFYADKNKQNIKDLKSCQKDYLQEEKELQRKISLGMKKYREKLSKEYMEIGHEIELSLAEQHIISVLDKYIEEGNFDMVKQYMFYMFRDYGIDLLENYEVADRVEYIKRILPTLIDIKMRKSILEEITEMIANDIEDIKSLIETKRGLFILEKKIASQ